MTTTQRTVLPLATILLLLPAVPIATLAQERPRESERPAELDVLDRYVGTWLHEATSKTANQTTTLRATEQAEWALDDAFVVGRAVNETNGVKSFWFVTVDRSDRSIYPFWYFGSNGRTGRLNGQWDEANQTMTLSPSGLRPGREGTVTHTFSDDSYTSSMTITNDMGETAINRNDIRTRQPESAGQRMLESWNERGAPTRPLPQELTKLAPLVGTWDSEYLFRVPQRPDARGVISDEWALDRRFIMRRESVGDTESIALIGWDESNREYRIDRAISNGGTNQGIGRWDDATRALVWNWSTDSDSDGMTAVATWRFVGRDYVQIHVVHEKEDEVLLDLTIKMERQE